jgi:hypothetical protein
MATQPRKNLNVGTIVDRTVEIVGKNVVPSVIFIAVFTVVGSATDYLAGDAPVRAALLSLIISLATIFGLYFLLQAMLRNAGFSLHEGGPRLLQYLGLGILSGLATALGLVVFIIPGLILMARWSIASVLLVGEGKGITESMGESWEKTRGSEMPIILTLILLLFLFVGVSIVASLYSVQVGIAGRIVARIASTSGNVVSTAIGVSIYSLLSSGKEAAKLFE